MRSAELASTILATATALAGGCYQPPRPNCGFACGPAGACPNGYSCVAVDNRCHLDSAPPELYCPPAAVDGGNQPPGPDTTPPFVMVMAPSDGSVGNSVATVVMVEFSEPVQSVSTASFELADSTSGTPIDGNVSLSGATVASFQPTRQLQPDSSFSVGLSSAITDVSLNPLSSVSWTFATGPDTVGPQVVSSQPVPSAVLVPTNSVIQVRFDEAPSGVDSSSFIVTAGGPAVTGTIAFSQDNTEVDFIPDADLPANTMITVEISTAISDMYGNHPASVYSFSFQTQ